MSWFNNIFGKKAPKRRAIIDIGDNEFKQQVIQRSYKSPVMVDFWAAWCGPCRQLGPTLERVAEDPESNFILAKLNTEHNQRVPARYNIRSIPAVKMFRNGKVVGEFTGAKPEALVRQFVDKVTSGPPPAPRVKRSGNPTKRLEQTIHHLRKGRGFEAFVLLQDFPAGDEAERADLIRPFARFLVDMADGDGLTGVTALDEVYVDTAVSLEHKKPKEALGYLTGALELGDESHQAHTHQVIEAILATLGENHQITKEYRA